MKEHQDAVSTPNDFPSPDFETKLRAAREAEDAAKANLVTLQKKISTIDQNRGLLELDNRDPEKEIRALRAEVKTAESMVQRSRQETIRILFEGRNQHDSIRAALWATIYEEVILPHVSQLKQLRAQLDSGFDNVSRLVVAQEDAASVVTDRLPQTIGAFDAATVKFNRLAREYKAPGQILVPENTFLCVQISETLAQNIRQYINIRKIEEMLKKLASFSQRGW